MCGIWTYHFPVKGSTIHGPGWKEGEAREVLVPGVWEQLPDKVNYRGQVVARKVFTTSERGAARLVFKGVSHTCRVFLDGVEMGGHHNAYTPFHIDVPDLAEGDHELLLWISNEHGELSALHIPNDYYTYGGISRPVELHLLASRTYIDRVQCTPRFEKDAWFADLEVCLHNLDIGPASARLKISLAGKEEALDLECAPGSSSVRMSMEMQDIQPWGPSRPKLYTLKATLQTLNGTDDWSDRIGFREVAISGNSLYLNGDAIFLKGVNRHEDHPDYGCAIPLEMIRKDLELLRRLGANAIRTSHYPNDERFLDLCDEMGFLVWEENHARGLYPGDLNPPQDMHPMKHPMFREQCRLCNEEMVNAHFNHPSIIIWGILNECDSCTEYGRSCYKEQFEQLRSLDASRPLTFASCHDGDPQLPNSDICQDLPDICSWNYYHNWYSDWPVKEALETKLSLWNPLMDGKPYMISEFGGGGISGFRDPIRRAKWSEERQADVLDECLGVYLHHPRICGVFIWQFCDIRVDPAWAMKRPRTMNNKGIVDEHRRPKLAFETVRNHFQGSESGKGRL